MFRRARVVLNRRTQAGQAVLETALTLPVFLLLTLGLVDLGLVFQQYAAVGHAAEAGAMRAAALLSAASYPLQGNIPGAVADEARRAALSSAPNLQASRATVEVAWDGPVQTVSRPAPPYTFVVTVPDAPNEYRLVDLGHTHGFDYYQPRVYAVDVQDTYRPGVWYLDNTATTQSRYFTFPHSQGYWDYSGPSTWQGYPWGFWTGPIFGPAGVGWGGGVFLPFRTYAQSGGNWWEWKGTSTAAPGAWGTTIGSVYDAWLRTWTDPFTNYDANNAAYWQAFRGTFERADPVAYVGDYARYRGDRTFSVRSTDGTLEVLSARSVRVSVRYSVTAFTPLLRPFLEGRTISRTALARAERQEVR